MRVLVLESVSGLRGGIDSRLLPEGFAMLRTMVNEFSEAGFDVVTTLNRGLKSFAGWLDADVIFDHHALNLAIRSKPDAVLIIAPEKNGELEQITSKFRKRGIPLLGAGEEAIRVSGDKWLTYLALKRKVPQPMTWRRKPRVKRQILIKPIDGVGCEGIRFFSSLSNANGMIFQEFIKGEHVSSCLMMREGRGTVLSVNKQGIEILGGRFRYFGSEIPLEHRLARECSETALRAAEALNSHGFCGVDLVVNEIPYFMELNPRVTTSFIALAEISELNLGETLIDVLINGEPVPKLRLRGYSLIRIPRIKRDVKIDAGELGRLKKISGIVAPPFTFDGHLKKGSPMLVAVGSGSSARRARSKLRCVVDEASSLLGVEEDAIAWT